MNTTLAAALAGTTPRTIRRWIAQGTITAELNGRTWVVDADSLARHITRRADTTDWQTHQVASALDLIADAAILPLGTGAYAAISSDGAERYTCTPGTCTCKAAENGRRCFHILAARMIGRPHALAA